MAKVRGPLFSHTARGSLAKRLTYQEQRHAGAVVKSWAPPTDPRSAAQLLQREAYARAVAAWHALSPASREQYALQARPVGLLGYHLFLRQFLGVPLWIIGEGAIGEVRIA